MVVEDPDLVERLRKGDCDLWKKVYNDNLKNTRSLGYSQGFSLEVIDDIVQDTMLSAFKCIGSFQNNSKLSTWIYSIAKNCYRQQINYTKRRTRDSRACNDVSKMLGTNTDGYLRRQLEARNGIVRVSETLIYSRPRTYESVMLKAIGYSLNEIASLTGRSVSTVGSRVQLGRRVLKERRESGFLQ